jgi:hypothetical protein
LVFDLILVAKTGGNPLTRMMFSLPLPRGGREGGLAWPSPPSPQGHPGKHGLRLPDGPDTAAARLELAIG